jgi:hypothetical protein
MKFKRFHIQLGHYFAALALEALMACPGALQAQHVHVNAGSVDITQDAQLYFPNGFTYNTNAGYDVHLTFTNAGSFSNLYQGAGVSFTALASTLDNGGPAFGHAAEGAFLQLQFVSMQGPADGGLACGCGGCREPGHQFLCCYAARRDNQRHKLPELSESDVLPAILMATSMVGPLRPPSLTLHARLPHFDTSHNGAGRLRPPGPRKSTIFISRRV